MVDQRLSAFIGSSRYNVVYLNMPKSACSSIKMYLHKIDGGDDLDDPLSIHGRHDLLLRGGSDLAILDEKLKVSRTFTFVRHPIKRLYSCFNDKIFFDHKYAFPRVKKYIEKEFGANFSAALTLDSYRKNFYCFLEFVQQSNNRKTDFPKNPHWDSQAKRLLWMSQYRIIDFVGKVERMKNDFQAFIKITDIPDRYCELPLVNEGFKAPFGYEDVINERIFQLAMQISEFDFNVLGYEKRS